MLTKYGTDNIVIMLAIAVILFIIPFFIGKTYAYILFFAASIILAFFTFWFFRDPDRNIPEILKEDPALIVSPCDGKVLQIIDANEPNFMGNNLNQISIFLSPLDVHVNRIPISGEVKYFKYNPGDYIIANHPKSSELNEQTHIGIENNKGKLFFKQIVGVMARRLVWEIKQGDTVTAGDKFGMMKFGSRIDILLDKKSEIFIKVGDRVIAGETLIGRL